MFSNIYHFFMVKIFKIFLLDFWKMEYITVIYSSLLWNNTPDFSLFSNYTLKPLDQPYPILSPPPESITVLSICMKFSFYISLYLLVTPFFWIGRHHSDGCLQHCINCFKSQCLWLSTLNAFFEEIFNFTGFSGWYHSEDVFLLYPGVICILHSCIEILVAKFTVH
jgi:hypothetical protein